MDYANSTTAENIQFHSVANPESILPIETQLRSIKMELILGQDLNLHSTKWKINFVSVDWHENRSSTGPCNLFVSFNHSPLYYIIESENFSQCCLLFQAKFPTE